MTLPPAYSRFVAFGEILLRLSSQRGDLLSTARRLDLDIGGAEANVAGALATLGHQCALISAVPNNALGDAAVGAVRARGVECRNVMRAPGRMGLYWLENGAGHRPSEVIYDRAASAFSTLDPAAFDWPALLAGADRLHLSGITVALGTNGTVMALAAAAAATTANVPVSFDGNFRSQLWSARGGVVSEPLVDIASHADVLFGNHRDIGLFLGRSLPGETSAQRRAASEAAFAEFPQLRLIASTVRSTHDSDRHTIAARVDTPMSGYETEAVDVSHVVDRIGSGDAYAAGILHGDAQGLPLEGVAETGLALCVLKHSLSGDMTGLGQRYLDRYAREGGDVSR